MSAATQAAIERVRAVMHKGFIPYKRLKYRVPRQVKHLRAWDHTYLLFGNGRWSIVSSIDNWHFPGDPRHYSHRHPSGEVTKALAALVQLGLISEADSKAVWKLSEQHDNARRAKSDRKRDVRDLRRTAKRLGLKIVPRARRS